MKDLKDQSIDDSFQGVNKLFVLAFNDVNNDAKKVERDSHRKYFLPRVNITNYNVLIDGREFYIRQLMIKSKSMTKLERFQQEKDHYQLIAVHLSKQKELDSDPRAIQKIEFYGKIKTDAQVCTVLEKSKEVVLEFYKGTTKIL